LLNTGEFANTVICGVRKDGKRKRIGPVNELMSDLPPGFAARDRWEIQAARVDAVFSPIKIGGLETLNRVFRGPHGTGFTGDDTTDVLSITLSRASRAVAG